MLEDIAEGARYAAATPLIALILGLCCAVSLFVLNYNTLVPLIARDVLREGAHGFGLLMAALGAGAVLGALALARLDFERPPASLLLWAALAVSAATLSLAFVHRFWVAAPVLFVAGFSQILFAASANTTLQMSAPDHLRGRMMSLYAWVFVGSTPIGAFLIGSTAEQFGVLAACAAGGGSGLAAVAILAAWWRRRRA